MKSRLMLLLLLNLTFAAIAFAAVHSQPTLVDVSNQMSWLDKRHLGPLQILNFFAASWLISKFLKRLECWETPLRPLLLIGQHMLPVFCCQICLSILLIGAVSADATRFPKLSSSAKTIAAFLSCSSWNRWEALGSQTA
jgi:OpgC protein